MTALSQRTHALVNPLRVAESGLRIKSEMNILQARLDPLAEQIREIALHDTFSVSVPKVGIVKVARGADAKTETVWEVDEIRLAGLTEEDRKVLMQLGVIRQVRKTTNARKAAVTWTPNI